MVKRVYESEYYPEDDISGFEDEDYDDFSPEVEAGKDFEVDGDAYTWLQPESDTYNIDFDNWQVWSATHHFTDEFGSDDELAYFVVDIDTEFIDWGPADTKKEAVDFLDSKYDEYLED